MICKTDFISESGITSKRSVDLGAMLTTSCYPFAAWQLTSLFHTDGQETIGALLIFLASLAVYPPSLWLLLFSQNDADKTLSEAPIVISAN